jgi:hypothetical protein
MTGYGRSPFEGEPPASVPIDARSSPPLGQDLLTARASIECALLKPCPANRASWTGSEADTRRPASSHYPGGGRETRTLLRLQPQSSRRTPVTGRGIDTLHEKVTPRALGFKPAGPWHAQGIHRTQPAPDRVPFRLRIASGVWIGYAERRASSPSRSHPSFRWRWAQGPDNRRRPHTIEGYRSSASCLASGPFLRSRSSSGSEPGLPSSRSLKVGGPEDTWTRATCLQMRLVDSPFVAGKPAARQDRPPRQLWHKAFAGRGAHHAGGDATLLAEEKHLSLLAWLKATPLGSGSS